MRNAFEGLALAGVILLGATGGVVFFVWAVAGGTVC